MLSALGNRGSNLSADSRSVTMATPVTFTNPVILNSGVKMYAPLNTAYNFSLVNASVYAAFNSSSGYINIYDAGGGAGLQIGSKTYLTSHKLETVSSVFVLSYQNSGMTFNGAGNPVYLTIGNGVGSWDAYIGAGTGALTVGCVNNKTTLIQTGNASGSNIAGQNLTLAGGKHTGTPTTQNTGAVKIQTSLVGAAAAAQNSLVDRYIVKGGRLNLTNNTSVNTFNVALPTLTGTMGTIQYEVFATDGTDVQVHRGQAQYSAVNKGGVYTSEVGITSNAASCSTGTLTTAWDILAGTDSITLRANASTSLTPTTMYLCYTLENNSEQAIRIL